MTTRRFMVTFTDAAGASRIEQHSDREAAKAAVLAWRARGLDAAAFCRPSGTFVFRA